MAKLERNLSEDFTGLLLRIEQGILSGSLSASQEDGSDFRSGDVRCSVRVFERYSLAGENRVSMTVTLFQGGAGQPVQLSAITSGGSQALFNKLNKIGENRFLRKLEELL
ncbi:MAG: hypothetical protein E7319_06620 [Clostridiales bacterium]|nr:hypothetical protein [Clostridiales bacterium]